ncbi:MAG: hypothetical protein ACRD97_10090 [Nitrososphaeraceae archaeon]
MEKLDLTFQFSVQRISLVNVPLDIFTAETFNGMTDPIPTVVDIAKNIMID